MKLERILGCFLPYDISTRTWRDKIDTNWRSELNVTEPARRFELFAWPSDIEYISILDYEIINKTANELNKVPTLPNKSRMEASSADSGKLVT